MRRSNVFFQGVLIFQFLLGFYIFSGLVGMVHRPVWKAGFWGLFLVEELLVLWGLYVMREKMTGAFIQSAMWQNVLIGFAFAIIVTKFVLAIFFLLDDFFRVGHFAYAKLLGTSEAVTLKSRRQFIIQSGVLLASIPLLALIYGVLKGKYQYELKRLSLKIKNLPQGLNGLKIIQISDIHAGNLDSPASLRKAIEMINQQAPDLILFTGDLVNRDSREIAPFIDIFKELKAKYGKYSILGNHDYVEYKHWDTLAQKSENQELLYQFHREMDFRLLRNEHIKLTIDGEDLYILGVENWGMPPFPQYGDLDAALEGVPPHALKILLSHDPTHWDQIVLDHPIHIDLTLSGHTHGAQFGIDTRWLKWSPVKFVYKRWSGLYEEKEQYLYVNRGFGVLAFPGRVGMWPEISVFSLATS
ncbi:MAG TPA: metallophosphoesterase [Saprospiraceae bacterium]|nr:metallophosphoesterase [Saprospiraceae bacterium]